MILFIENNPFPVRIVLIGLTLGFAHYCDGLHIALMLVPLILLLCFNVYNSLPMVTDSF